MPMAAEAEMEGAHPTMPAPGDQLAEPMQMVLGLLDKLGAMDPQRIFDAPVDGNVVRGYYDKIKQPMCFQWMREKVRTRQYRTWRSFVADFELMCNNARHFNPPQHKVNRLATGLMRSGKKLLQQHELLGRRCLYALHPEGPKAAAEEEEAQLLQSKEQQQQQHGQDPQQQARSSSHGAPTTTSMDADTHSGDLGYAGGDAGAVKEEPAEAASLPPPPPELLSTAAQLWDPNIMSISGGDWGLLFRAVPEPTIDATTQHLKPPVVFAPYLPTPLALPPLRGTPGASSSSTPQQQEGQQPQQQQQQPGESQEAPGSTPAAGRTEQQQQQQEEGPAGPSQQPEQQQGPPPAISSQDAAAADVLWRCHWLELRMRQLQHLLRLMDAAPPPAAPAPPPPPAPAPAAAPAGVDGAPGAAGDGGAADATAAAAAAVGAQQAAAAAAGPEPGWEFPPGVPHIVGTAGGVLLPQHLQHADAAAHPEHPFFVLQRGEALASPAPTPTTATAAAAAAAAAAGGIQPSSARGTQPQKHAAGSSAAAAGKGPAAAAAAAGKGPAAPQQQEPGLEGLDAGAAAAAAASVYTSLDLLELRLIQMRSKLAAAYGIEAGLAPEGIRIGAYAAAHLDTPRQRGPLARQGSMAGGGGGATGGGWGSSARGLQREASGSIKRRRTMTGEDEAASGGARIDRQVSNIHIPQVRTLSTSELAARAAAIAALQAAGLTTAGSKRGRSLPPEVTALCDPDEGSSSEDTSDSAYAAMHAPLEEEEHIRLNGFPAGGQGGQNKKDKSKSKNPGDKAGGSSKGPAGKGGRGGGTGGGGGGGGGSSSAARGRAGPPSLPRAGSLTPLGTAGSAPPGLLPTHTSAPAALLTAAAAAGGNRGGGNGAAAAAAGTAVGVVPGEVTSGVTPGELAAAGRLQQQQPHLAVAQQLLHRQQQQPAAGGGNGGNGMLQANGGEAPVTPVKRGPSGDPSDCLGEPSQSVGSGARRLAVTPLVSSQPGGDSPVPSGHMCLPAAAVQPSGGAAGANSMPASAAAAVPVLAGSGRMTEEPTPPPPKAPSHHKAVPAKGPPQIAARAGRVAMGTRSMDVSTRRGTSRSSGGGGGGGGGSSKGATRSSSGKRG